jgi:hypothetical protein
MAADQASAYATPLAKLTAEGGNRVILVWTMTAETNSYIRADGINFDQIT